jgi:dihydroorotate dehydrogenase
MFVASQLETGGLSGPPLKPISLAAIRTLRSQLPEEIVLIGCGGISSGSDALEYAKAGASMVQMYTNFGYDGVGACRRIKDEIVQELRSLGDTWSSLVKKSISERSWTPPPPEQITVQQLIREAEDLQKMLDDFKFGEGIDLVKDEPESAPPLPAVAPAI